MNFQMNMAADANRAWRSVDFTNAAGVFFSKNAFLHDVATSSLTFTFLTGHPTDQLPSRNIVPYCELPVYRTVGSSTIPGRALLVNADGGISEPPKGAITGNNLQLNMIPDKLILFIRRTHAMQDTSYTDSFLSITGININFNNNAGLLSSMTQAQLYKASVASGLKKYELGRVQRKHHQCG